MYTNLLTNAVIFGDKLDATHPYGQDRLEWSLEPGSDLAWSFYGKNRSFLCCCNVNWRYSRLVMGVILELPLVQPSHVLRDPAISRIRTR
ncbi:hypothetical protein H9L39_04372 [Fusarium oxysporum f. sp. albedinis]|nr:hypothetical protein H9L39_04372 [Fusarium oxysporum f. sp. albedinis]